MLTTGFVSTLVPSSTTDAAPAVPLGSHVTPVVTGTDVEGAPQGADRRPPGHPPSQATLPAEPGGSWAARRYVLLVTAALVVALALRIAVSLTDEAPTTDETAYLRSGTSLVAGDGFERNGEPELHFPPVVPVLLGLANEVFDDAHTGAVVLTLVFSTALVLPLAGLARRIGGPTAGAVTAWVAAIGPGLSTSLVNRGAGSEAVYLFLVATALWCVVSAAGATRRGRAVRAAGAGLVVGLAYLTRPEGLFFAVPVGLAVLFLGARVARGQSVLRRARAAAPLAVCFAIPLVLCIAPYAAYLYDHTGKVQLSAKAQDASIEAWLAVAQADRAERDSVLWALDETGLHFANTERESLPSLAAGDPGGYAAIVGTNVASLVEEVVFPEKGEILAWVLLPFPLWVLAGIGAWRARRSWTARLVLAATALPVATCVVFFVQPRYLFAAAALATVFVGVAVASLGRARVTPIVAAALALLVLSSVAGFRSQGAGWWHPSEGLDQREAGEWIAANAGPDDRVLTRSMVVEFYAERPAMAIPYAEMDEIITYARHYGATYVVVDWYTLVRLRPQLAPLRDPSFEVPGLRLVWKERVEGRTTRIYAVEPAPAADRPMGPPLGFVGDG